MLLSAYSQTEMFIGASSFNGDVTTWDVSKGTSFVSGLDYFIDVIVIKMMLLKGKATYLSY